MTSVLFDRVAETNPSITPSSALVNSHLISGMAAAQNKKTMPEGMAKRFDPEGETGDEPNRRERAARTSSGLLFALIGKQIRVGQPQVHHPGVWDALVTPL